MINIGSELKTERVKAGFKQLEVAKILGVGPVTVSRWECDHTTPNLATGIILLSLYGTDLVSFFKKIVSKKIV